jgi:transketolase
LGHGFPIALGMALAKKIKKEDGNIYCLIGDGESNEGTIWETALLAAHHKLDNLICIMDHNKSGDRALTIDPVGKKFESFNWDVEEIDGHNQEEIINCLLKKRNKPTFILANTIKGKGISFMENNPEWHHKAPTEEDLIKIYKEILPNE